MAFAGNQPFLKTFSHSLICFHAGLKALALLGVLPDGNSTPGNQAPPVIVPTRTAEEKEAVQVAEEPADAGSFVHCNVSNSLLHMSNRATHTRGRAERLRADSTRITWVLLSAPSDLGHITTTSSLLFSHLYRGDNNTYPLRLL